MVEEILGRGGRFEQVFPEYEYRPQQLEMAEIITRALQERRHCMVEAGTGVGKTVAYLLPAVLHSQSGGPVVVSTHTINLQGQLVGKDIPLMQQVISDPPFSAVQLKGRANYLCLHELDLAGGDPSLFEDPGLERIREWAAVTQTGDVAELDFSFPFWHEICSNQDTCRRQECQYHQERCLYYRMRSRAAEADIIVVNHSLYFVDLALRILEPRNAMLPKHSAVIMDEAHHLEDVAGKTFGVEFTNYRIPSFLNRVRRRRDIAVTSGELNMIDAANSMVFELFSRVPKQEFFFDDALDEARREQANALVGELVTMLDGLNTQLGDQETEGKEQLKERIDGFRRMLGRMRDDLGDIFFREHGESFRWCNKPSSGKFVNCCLHLTPINVSDILQEHLFGRLDTAVLTSATLSNSGGFNYIRSRIGVPEDSLESILGSPFDFMEQALLYVPNDLPEPSEKWEYADLLAERIGDIVRISQGRAFLLFTSYRMMNGVYDRLKDTLPFRLLKQGEMSNDRLLGEFRDSEDACLFGVHSFWEGVDVKGERLSCVVIDKLPFAVPDSPINRARCDAITDAGGNWFREYAMPQALIRLKQGFGRLIRTKVDHGVVCILDSRIHKKYYGREFLRYLPRCRGTMKLDDVQDFLSSSRETVTGS
jgi:ATP-dependent DNA helicase DinG